MSEKAKPVKIRIKNLNLVAVVTDYDPERKTYTGRVVGSGTLVFVPLSYAEEM